MTGKVAGLLPFAHQVQDAVPAQGVDADQVRQGAVVDGDALGDLHEPDQLAPLQALGSGLVALDLRQPGRTRPGRPG